MKQTRREFLQLLGKIAFVTAGVSLAGFKVLESTQKKEQPSLTTDNQISIWTDSGKIEGDSTLTWIGSNPGLGKGDLIEVTGTTNNHNGTYRISEISGDDYSIIDLDDLHTNNKNERFKLIDNESATLEYTRNRFFNTSLGKL